MLAAPGIRDFDYSSLKYFIYAAAPISEEKLKLAIDVFGPVMAQTFGQAESPMICCFLSPKPRVTCCALTLPATQLRIPSPQL